MKIIIDRFEGNFAVVEVEGSNNTIDIPLEVIPEKAQPGDVLCIKIDREATQKRKNEIEKLMDDVWED